MVFSLGVSGINWFSFKAQFSQVRLFPLQQLTAVEFVGKALKRNKCFGSSVNNDGAVERFHHLKRSKHSGNLAWSFLKQLVIMLGFFERLNTNV